MNFEWDERKNRSNFKKHKITFGYATEVFDDPLRIIKDDETHSVFEERYIVIGKARDEVVLFVNEIEVDDDTIRLISARKATNPEKEEYYGNCALYLGKLPEADAGRTGHGRQSQRRGH